MREQGFRAVAYSKKRDKGRGNKDKAQLLRVRREKEG